MAKKLSSLEKNYVVKSEVFWKGKFSQINVARRKKDGRNVLVKSISTTELNEQQIKRIRKEVKVLVKLELENIATIYEWFSDSSLFSAGTVIKISMERVEGRQLFSETFKFADNHLLDEKEVKSYMFPIIQTLHKCYKKGVLHGNLTPENLIVDQNGKIKIVGFCLGLDRNWQPFDEASVPFVYVAPELLADINGIQNESISDKSDVWSLGVICFVLLSNGLLPNFGQYTKSYETDEKNSNYEVSRLKSDHSDEPFNLIFEPIETWMTVSYDAKLFLRKILVKDPKSRPTYQDLLSHPWLKSCFKS